MADAEMVKAMEICKDKEIPCDDCPLVKCGDCGEISRQYFYDRFKQLQSENAELKSSLTHANEECLKWHERAQNLLKDSGGSISGYEKKISALQSENAALRERLGKAVELPFIVIDKKTGKEADEYEIALHEDWAKHLMCCDMEGFAIEQDGTLILLDECGQFVYCSSDRFEVVPEARLAELEGEAKNG